MNDTRTTHPFSFPPPIAPPFRSRLSVSTDVGVAGFLIITGIVSIAGNGLVLLVLARKRKELRPHELMTINLAICDFGYSLLGAPCLIISSFSHGWVFGDTGCLLYGIQGFVFGIGSLLTTCVISLDRCLKICSLRYGHWIERRHLFLAILLVWLYAGFWATLPAFGFGSYAPEPFGTSCTINWWRLKLSINDRVYIFLILTLCFCVPTCVIVTSYLAIYYTVYRSRHDLASISSTRTHSSKDLKLTKIAAVVCSSFLIAWTPYAAVSLYTALTAREEQEALGFPMTGGGAGPAMVVGGGYSSTEFPAFVSMPSLLNWTTTQNPGPTALWATPKALPSSKPDLGPLFQPGASQERQERVRAVSSLPPVLTLIPAMFAKAHCMINPFIYQIMNREFREDVYHMLGLRRGARRPARITTLAEGKHSFVSLSHHLSWGDQSPFGSAKNKKHGKSVNIMETEEVKEHTNTWSKNTTVDWPSTCTYPSSEILEDLATGMGQERHIESISGQQGSSASCSLLACEDGHSLECGLNIQSVEQKAFKNAK